MFLTQLKLSQFKNHALSSFLFDRQVVVFCGKNGVGKTNILDAIYYLCLGRSYFSSTDKIIPKKGSDFFRLEGTFSVDDEKTTVVCTYQLQKKKHIKVDDIPLNKLSEHLGRFPVVIIAPDDNTIVLGGSEERRRFVDRTLIQTNQTYFEALSTYNKVLAQRNALLKSKHTIDSSLLAVYTEQMAKAAPAIYTARKEFVNHISPFFQESQQSLSDSNEQCTIAYQSDLEKAPLEQLLKECAEKDQIVQRTTKGIHRDDFIFMMNGEPIKSFGSQGQQKTFLIALKMAQKEYLKKHTNKMPFLILDDIFDKLDAARRKHLIELLLSDDSQLFISHTSTSDIIEHFEEEDIHLFQIE